MQKVLLAASEAVPFIKTGGLADVAGTLPIALKQAGADARVILPKYRDIAPEWAARMQYITHFYVGMGWRKQYCGLLYADYQGVRFYFIDNEFYFSRESVYGDGQGEGERFGFFCRAVLEALPKLDFFPDILHCNDWQTGMIPALLKTQYQSQPEYAGIRVLYTIHNLKFQGVFDWGYIDEMLGLGAKYYSPDYLEYYGCVSFMKGGIVFADMVSTVSPTYALEIQSPYYGERLDGLLRCRGSQLAGILNGIDNSAYNPATDPAICAHFTPEDLSGKAACKAALQRELGLEPRSEAAVIAMVTRLTEQKGLDLVERVLEDMMRQDIQLVVVGLGEQHYQELLSWAQWRYQGRISARFELNEALAHQVYAGADLFLMPSKFEPCGLSQMIALRYGTVPVVRETGGLRDSIQPYNKYTDEGTGFSFANFNAHEMLFTLERAVDYFHDHKLWQRLQRRGMAMDFGWDASARRYLALYEDMLKGRAYPEDGMGQPVLNVHKPQDMPIEEPAHWDAEQQEQEALPKKAPMQKPPTTKAVAKRSGAKAPAPKKPSAKKKPE